MGHGSVVYSRRRIVNKVNIRMYINIHFCIYSVYSLWNLIIWTFAQDGTKVTPAGVCVCTVAMEGIILLRLSSSAIILAVTRLWMGAYCTSERPVKLIEETFPCYCDSHQIFYTRGYRKSLGMDGLFGESIAWEIKTKC